LGLVGLIGLIGPIGLIGDYEGLAVAYHPQLAAQAAEDDAAGRETVFRMLGQMGQQRLDVAAADGLCGPFAKLVAADVLRHLLDESGNGAHSQLAVAVLPQRVVLMAAALALRGGAVDDGYEVRGDDDAVLASLCGVLRYEGLFEDFHGVNGAYRTPGPSGTGEVNRFSGTPGPC